MIQDLQVAIHTRRNLTPPIEGVNNNYGMNSKFLTQMLDYWERDYDFKGRALYLNRYPQFVTNVQGLDMHFAQIKPGNTTKRRIPILLIHGSPLTLFEYNNIFEDLLTPRIGFDFVFEIIAPDLPGYGYSQVSLSRFNLESFLLSIKVHEFSTHNFIIAANFKTWTKRLPNRRDYEKSHDEIGLRKVLHTLRRCRLMGWHIHGTNVPRRHSGPSH